MPKRLSHWILVALLVLAAIFTLSETSAQTRSPDAQADIVDPVIAANNTDMTLARKSVEPRARKRDTGVAKDTGSTTRVAGRSVRKQAERLRNPTSVLGAR